jgi:hypothetical protein
MRDFLQDVADRYPGRVDLDELAQRLKYGGIATNEFLDYMRREDGGVADQRVRERFKPEAAALERMLDMMFPW